VRCLPLSPSQQPTNAQARTQEEHRGWFRDSLNGRERERKRERVKIEPREGRNEGVL
jgi:hypothetical protein